jgi:hypothetical protein
MVSGSCATKNCIAWVLHETSNIQEPVPYFASEMLRQLSHNAAQTRGVLMPPGRVALALYDPDRREYSALTFLDVAPLKVMKAQPAAPAKGRSSLILELVRPAMVEQRPHDDIGVALVTEDGRRVPASFTTRTHRKVIAIWPDVPAGAASIELQSGRVHLPEKVFQLGSGRVEYAKRQLAANPKLGVILEIPEALQGTARELLISERSAEIGGIKRVELAHDQREVSVQVPATSMDVRLVAGPWETSERVDLSDGIDRTVTLKLEAIKVTGTVYSGKEPVSATIVFDTRDEWEDSLTVNTDEHGRYEALFAKPRGYIALVRIEGRAGPFAVPPIDIDRDMEYDFRLPNNEYTFRVTSKRDGSPIAGASVIVRNTAADKIVTDQLLRTGDDGVAVAQPLREGEIAVSARADGFHPSSPEVASVRVEGVRSFEFHLEPTDDDVRVTVRLPNGEPARGAEVFVADGPLMSTVLQADGEGMIRVPESARGALLLVRAMGAAWSGRRVGPDDEGVTWSLEAPAPPLVLRCIHAGGAPADCGATLWLDGSRLFAAPLAWLTAGPGMTGPGGYWVLTSLPPRPVDVLFWASTTQNAISAHSGMYDMMRTTVPYPWPAETEIRALE